MLFILILHLLALQTYKDTINYEKGKVGDKGYFVFHKNITLGTVWHILYVAARQTWTFVGQ